MVDTEDRTTLQPYKHDCDACLWVGWIHVKGGGKTGNNWGNMYYCPREGDHGSVIIRFSDQSDDYWSSGVLMGAKGGLSVSKDHL